MTPARSVIAGAVALGFASTLTTPLPALAAPLPALAAPADCAQPGHHAAQATAGLLRINRLELGAIATKAPRSSQAPSDSASPSPAPSASASASTALPDSAAPSGSASPAPRIAEDQAGFAPAGWAPSATPGVRADDRTGRAIGDVGLGDARSVLIADGPVKSAAAARVLDGRVAGASAHNDLLVQQAPPTNRKAAVQRLGGKRFRPMRAGGGRLTVHARWAEGMGCGAIAGEASTSAASLTRVSVDGGGSQSLVRIPEKFAGATSTALRHRADQSESVATATFQGGKVSLADGEVRIRVLRAAKLQVSMSGSGHGEVRYEPALVEITGQDGKIIRLDTSGDHTQITLRKQMRALESVPALIKVADPLPVPRVSGLPVLVDPESARVPAGSSAGMTIRIALGDVRQATRGRAIAARATAVKVSLVRTSADSRTKTGYGQSDVVADLGFGLLESGAIAPKAGTPGASPVGTDGGAGASTGAGAVGLPITGTGIASLMLSGAGLLVGGVLTVLLGTRRRRT